VTTRRYELPLALALFAAAIVIVDPRGNFPLDDDWDFAIATWRFAESGVFRFTPFTAVSLRLQVLWGALWALLFGQSFTVLRVSTLFLSAATIVVFHRFLRQLPLAPRWRTLALFSLIAHPIFFWSSFTYMTQVPYLFLSVVAMAAFYRGVRDESVGWMVAGALAAVGSFFIRQTGVVNAVPPLVALVLLRQAGSARRTFLLTIAAAPVVLFAALYLGTDLLSASAKELTGHTAGLAGTLEHAASYPLTNAAYGGLFVLPLLVASWSARGDGGRSLWREAAAALLCGLYAIWGLTGAISGVFPSWSLLLRHDVLFGNVLVNLGSGPLTLVDVEMLGLPGPGHVGLIGCGIVSVVAGLAGAAVYWRLGEGRQRSLPFVLGVTHLIAATGILLASNLYFDRYALDSTWTLLFLLPLTAGSRGDAEKGNQALRPSAFFAAPREDDSTSAEEAAGAGAGRRRATPAGRGRSEAGRFARGMSIVLLGGLFLFSVAGTHDYLAWNRARLEAVHWLRDRQVPLAAVNLGYEWNAFLRLEGASLPVEREEWTVGNDYVLAFSPLPGYEEVARFRYPRLLGRAGWVRVEKRTAAARSVPATGSWR
jgi:hypothetical protein